MTRTNQITTMIDRESLGKHALIGGIFALILIAIFLYGVNNPDLNWGNYWMIRPLLIVSLAGATGGIVYYFMKKIGMLYNWNQIVIVILSLLVYIVGLWMGFVLGLAGTLWN